MKTLKNSDPWARFNTLLSDGEFKPASNIIEPGEKLLPKYKVNKHGVVINPVKLLVIDFHPKKWKGVMHVLIKGAETDLGRWVTSLDYNFNNFGGCGPGCLCKKCNNELYENKETAIYLN